jgi:hypothetical protein
LEANSTAVCQRDSVERQQSKFVCAFRERNRVVAHKCDSRICFTTLHNQRMTATLREKHRRAGAILCHFSDERIVCIEDRGARRSERFHDRTFHLREVFDRLNVG